MIPLMAGLTPDDFEVTWSLDPRRMPATIPTRSGEMQTRFTFVRAARMNARTASMSHPRPRRRAPRP
jgi:hypothetical protein